jgi:hypothetical protein
MMHSHCPEPVQWRFRLLANKPTSNLGAEITKTIIHADPLPVNFRSKEEKPKDTEGHLPPLC